MGRVRAISIYIYPDQGKHNEPHFYAVIRGEGQASFAISDLRRLSPRPLEPRYEQAVTTWAQRVQPKLQASWDAATARNRPLELDI